MVAHSTFQKAWSAMTSRIKHVTMFNTCNAASDDLARLSLCCCVNGLACCRDQCQAHAARLEAELAGSQAEAAASAEACKQLQKKLSAPEAEAGQNQHDRCLELHYTLLYYACSAFCHRCCSASDNLKDLGSAQLARAFPHPANHLHSPNLHRLAGCVHHLVRTGI